MSAMIWNIFIRFWVCFCFGIHFNTSVLGADNKPCIWMDGGRKIGGIDGCRYKKAMGRNVLIDFRSAARSSVPSCTCHIQVVDQGFVAFHVHHVPPNDNCNSVVTLGSFDGKARSRYECGQRHPTRLVSLDDKALVTLSVNKTGSVKEASSTAFCFRISGNVELYVKCFPDTVVTSMTPADLEPTKNPESPAMKLTVAIPATLGGVAFILVLVISILCLVRRQIKKAKSNGYTSSSELTGTDSEYSGISTIRGSESIRSYDDIMPGDYLSLRNPDRFRTNLAKKKHNISTENVSKANSNKHSNPISEDVGHKNIPGHLSTPQQGGITSEYDTSGYYDDDEHPYDVISEDPYVYANSNDSVANGNDEGIRYNHNQIKS